MIRRKKMTKDFRVIVTEYPVLKDWAKRLEKLGYRYENLSNSIPNAEKDNWSFSGILIQPSKKEYFVYYFGELDGFISWCKYTSLVSYNKALSLLREASNESRA
jgi:hypothetical protein